MMQRAKQPTVLSERFNPTFSEMKVKPKNPQVPEIGPIFLEPRDIYH